MVKEYLYSHNFIKTYFVAVVVVCANPTTVREIMLAADDLNMVSSGEYVFFNIELFSKYVYFIIYAYNKIVEPACLLS